MRRNDCHPERLGELLEERKITPQELSKRTDVPIATIRAYLSGRRDAISTRNMLLFAQVLEMPMAELVDYLAGIVNIDKR